MILFPSRLKVRAAARSMHQFCSAVRAVLPEDTDDPVVESVTLFLYLQMAREVFGRRFARRVWRQVRGLLKFTTPSDVNSRIGRIAERARKLKHAAASRNGKSPEAEFNNHVCSVVQSILGEAGIKRDEALASSSETFDNFERAVRRIKEHLIGIKRQNPYLMQ